MEDRREGRVRERYAFFSCKFWREIVSYPQETLPIEGHSRLRASRPGGLSYGDITCIETGRSLLPGESRPGGLAYQETLLER